MEIGEQDLAGPQLCAFGCQRLLHFDDHLASGEHICGCLRDLRADGAIRIVCCADAHACLRFHQYLVPARGEFADALWRKADPKLIVLDLFWNADLHARDSRRVRLPEFRGYRI